MPANPTDHAILPALADRWSPYRFQAKSVDDAALCQCLEAARWAASSYNEQPWSWLVARRQDDDDFERALGCLMEANQTWAKSAGAILISVFSPTFARNGSPNRVALHDLGQAAAMMSVQASALGLQVHQMGGINLSKVRVEYGIPDDQEPQTAIAIGHPDPSEPASEAVRELQRREQGSRKRKPLAEQVFRGRYGAAADWVG